MTTSVRCEWRRYPDGFQVVERERKAGDKATDGDVFEPWLWLTPRNPDRWETYVLEGTENRICLALANMPLTQEGVLSFANRWGTFGVLMGAKASDDEQMTVIGDMAVVHRQMIEHVVDGEPGPDFDDWVQENWSVLLTLRRGRLAGDTESRNFLQAEALYAFCCAEFVELLESGVEFRRCPRCGKLLARGKVGKPQIYCSDACLMAMYRRRKKARAAREDTNVVNLMDSCSAGTCRRERRKPRRQSGLGRSQFPFPTYWWV